MLPKSENLMLNLPVAQVFLWHFGVNLDPVSGEW
jgi:hypothetical protein